MNVANNLRSYADKANTRATAEVGAHEGKEVGEEKGTAGPRPSGPAYKVELSAHEGQGE